MKIEPKMLKSKVRHVPTQVTPFPSYPALHVHLNLGTRLEQLASFAQLCVLSRHSSISEERREQEW